MIFEKKRELRAKEKELQETQTNLLAEKDAEEVKKLSEKCQKIIDEMNAIKDEILELEEQEEKNKNDNQRSFNPLNTYSFRTNNTEKKDYLQRGEKFNSRFNVTNKNLDLGKYVRGLVTGNWENATEERDAFSTSAMGAIIPQELSGQIIDYARELSLFAQSGVKIYPMTSNKMTIGRVAKDPVFSFKGEGAKGQEVSFDLESVDLESKTAYGYAYVPIETIQSASNLREILHRVFAQAIANAIDNGLLYGQETDPENAPSGIMNDDKINVINATNERYDDFIKGIGAVRRNNGTPTVMAINADTEEKLSLFYDDNNVYREAPESVKALNRVVTNQLKHDEESGTNDALIFDPNAIAIGVQKEIIVKMITESDKCIENGLVGFQIYAMLDGKATQPKHIARIKNYTGVISA